jgi:2-desacetyl-2-hydroxyethyl bacteriochlorophyllide A dehydrogenase
MMTATMRRAVLTAIRRFDIETVPVPDVAPEHVRLRVQASGVCGSDLHTYLGENPVLRTPLAPGHEFSGTVEAVGEGVTNVGIGDLVAARPSVPCGTCAYCQAGQEHLCDDMRFVGSLAYDGAFAEYVVLPAACVSRVDASWSAGVLSFAEPAAVAVHTIKLPGDIRGQSILIIGCGTIGLLVTQTARLAGASVSVTDLVPEKVALAVELGGQRAETHPSETGRLIPAGGNAFDCVFDCVGHNATLDVAMKSVKKGGTVVLVGVPVEPIKLDPVAVLLGERRLIGSYIYTNEEFDTALELILRREILVEPLITASYPLASISQVFELAVAGNERIKLLLEP